MQDIDSNIKSVSVVIPVSERGDNFENVFKGYHSVLTQLEIKLEFIIVLAPQYAHLSEALQGMHTADNPVKVIILNRNYGEAGELKIGAEHSQFDYILNLPAYQQIDDARLPEIFNAVGESDVLIVNRWPRIDHVLNKIQSKAFKYIFKLLAYNSPKDPGSGIRLSRREVFDDIKLYGDMHRFFTILAENSGFATDSVDIPQSQSDAHPRVYSLRTYFTRFLDILTIVFLSRFNKKPLRFFGAGGAFSAFVGIAGLGFMSIQRIFYDIPMGDRPLLILFALFLVLGIQLIAIGLVGETIIFTNSKDNQEYRIRKIVN